MEEVRVKDRTHIFYDKVRSICVRGKKALIYNLEKMKSSFNSWK